MNTATILTQSEVNQQEMLHVVRDYIRVRTGIDTPLHLSIAGSVKIVGGNTVHIPSPHEAQLLHRAFRLACEWFAKNRSKIPQP